MIRFPVHACSVLLLAMASVSQLQPVAAGAPWTQEMLSPPRGSSLIPNASDSPRGNRGDPDGFLKGNGADWIRWWAFNREPWLAEARTPGAGAVEPMPLKGDRAVGRLPNLDLALVHGEVVPALQARLTGAKRMELTLGCLLALGKIGEIPRSLASTLAPGPVSVEGSIRSKLKDSSGEVQGAALLALGLVGGPRATATLYEVAAGLSPGQRALGGGGLSDEVRAKAIYGLGLVAHHSKRSAERTSVVARLMDLAETEAHKESLSVAAVIGLGWASQAYVLNSGRSTSGDDAQDLQGQEGTIRRLLELFDDRKTSTSARAQLPVAVARLVDTVVGPIDPATADRINVLRAGLRAEVLGRFSRGLALRGGEKSSVVREGLVQAFGLLVEPRSEGPDHTAIVDLTRAAEGRSPRLGGLAQVALARIAARATGHADLEPVAKEIAATLQELLAKGSDTQASWSCLALGLYEHGKKAAGGAPSLATRSALHTRIGVKHDTGGAAASVALGLAGDHEVHAALIDEMANGDFMTRGIQSTALALMGAREALRPLREVIVARVLVPSFQREAAIALTMYHDEGLVDLLVARLDKAQSTEESTSALRALARCHDPDAVPALMHILKDKRNGRRKIDDRSRAMAATALGSLCSRRALPWNTHLALDITWSAAPPTLTNEESGGGVLDIL